jgi:hypothetical protein
MNTKTKELPEDIKTWVDALESGEYPQTTGSLCNTEGYCCLGVYAKVVLGLGDKQLVGALDTHGDPFKEEGPSGVYNSIKIELDGEDTYKDGIRMNDAGETFVDIAKMIREAYT